MSELTTVARPYARAAFELAVENDNIKAWSEMLLFAAEVVTNPTVEVILSSTKTAQELADLLINICDDKLDKSGQNLINLMAENGRLSVLPRVAELYADLVTEHNQEIDVIVVSAYALAKKQKEELSKSLEKRLARKVNLNCSIDKSLISGMVITAGDLVIDSTASGQLNRLSDTLQS
ncbi:F0F1 ATP synthase subunit delta [Psychromonas ossibalaenae]|uniref:F0F1 ATP synthase subunit delta n=1 Tax=Psychromonas ossibalaenae TaxID=444922 RepID=UPI00036C0B1F|nr:F0F1 ATP synthase subunit delta [Psychromonas ossibalaenae]